MWSLVSLALAQPPELVRQHDRHEGIGMGVFSPDGAYVTTWWGALVEEWDPLTARVVSRAANDGSHAAVRYGPDGPLVFWLGQEEHGVEDVRTGTLLWTIPRVIPEVYRRTPAWTAAWSPDGARIAVQDLAGRILDGETGDELVSYGNATHHPGGVPLWSPDGRLLVTKSHPKAVAWHTDTGQLAWALRDIDRPIGPRPPKLLSAAFSPDGRWVVTANDDGIATVYSAETGIAARYFVGHGASLTQATFTPDGRSVLTASKDGTARLWNLDGTNRRRFLGHEASVTGAELSPDGALLLTWSDDGTAAIWNARTGERLRVLEPELPRRRVLSGSWAHDGKRVFVGLERRGSLFDVTSGQLLRHLPEGEPLGPVVLDLAFVDDGDTLVAKIASGPSDRRAHTVTWTRSGATVAEGWSLDSNPNGELARSANGDRMAIAAEDRKSIEIRFAGSPPRVLPVDPSTVRELWFARERVVINGYQTVETWRFPSTGTALSKAHQLKHPGRGVRVVPAPDGRSLALHGVGQVWSMDVATGRIGEPLSEHEGFVYAVAFSPDSQRLLTVADRLGIIWDLPTRKVVARLEGHDNELRAAAWSPRGVVATGSLDGSVRLWDAEDGELRAVLTADRDGAWTAFDLDGRTMSGTVPEDRLAWSVGGRAYLPGWLVDWRWPDLLAFALGRPIARPTVPDLATVPRRVRPPKLPPPSLGD